jgi:uncharacterized protein YceK
MKSKIVLSVSILIVLSFILSGCSALMKKYEKKDTVEYQVNTTGKTSISLDNSNGNISLVKSDSSRILFVRAIKIDKVRKNDLDKPLDYIEIKIDTSGDRISIKSDMHRAKSFISFSTYAAQINYELIIPANLNISIENTSGNIDMTGFSSTTELDVTNGNVKAERFSGKGTFDITNGTLEGSFDSTKGINISVVNGSVKLELSKAFTGTVDADVTNGKITNENLQFTNVQAEKRSFKGYIVNPEPVMKIDVVNGKIALTGK